MITVQTCYCSRCRRYTMHNVSTALTPTKLKALSNVGSLKVFKSRERASCAQCGKEQDL